jgi:hypothetical protein
MKNAVEATIITRKTLIKRINAIRDERNKAREEQRTEDMRILNARLSEIYRHYNDTVKTQRMLEDHIK